MSRWVKIGLLLTLAVVLGALLGGVFYLRSESFRRYLLARVVDQIERTSGGRVETGAFDWSLRPLQAELHGLVIHGKEGPGQPLLSADSVVIQFHVISLFRREIDWRLLRVSRPVMYLVVDPGGNTNIPEPRIKRLPGRNPLEPVWALAIKRLEVHDGVFILNDERINLDFSADNVRSALNYRAATRDYTGELSCRTEIIPRLQTPGMRPVSLPAEVRASLLLRENSIEATSITVHSARSVATATGRLAPFVSPMVDIDYTARLDAVEAALLADNRDVRGGTAELRGAFHYDIGAHFYTTSGDLRLERFALRGPDYDIPRLDGTAKYSLTNGAYLEADFPAFHLYLFGGELTGRGHGDDRQHAFRVTASTQIHGLSVARVREMLSTPDFPADRLAWAGSIGGQAAAQFRLASGRKNLRDVRVQADVRIEPPAVTPPGHIPVAGAVALDYVPESGSVTLRNVLLQTPGSRISANGTLNVNQAGSRAAMTLDANVTKLEEWQEFIAALRPGQPALPLQLSGQAGFRGEVTGPLAALSLNGHLQASNFTYDGRHWDRFTGDIAYSPALLRLSNAQLVRGGASAQLSLTAGLSAGSFTETSPITLDARVQNAQLADLQSLAGTAYPINGQVTATVHLTGTRANPQGNGAVQIGGGTLFAEPFDSLRADLLFANQELQANNITLRRGAASITGQAAYRASGQSFRFQLAGKGLPLGDIQYLRSQRLRLLGTANFQASGEGTLERPAVNADLLVADLLVNGEQVGTVNAHVETRQRELIASVQTRLLRGNLAADLSARMEGDFPGQARVEFTGVDLDPLLAQEIRSRVTRSTASGIITLSGPFKRPESLAGRADITDFKIAIGQADFHNTEPLRASFQNGVIRIDRGHLVGNQTDMNVSGTLKVTGPPAAHVLALRIGGAVNLALLGLLNPDVESSGQVVVAATVSGTLARPQLTGRAEFSDGNLALRDLATGLSNIRGTVLFDARRMQVRELTAQVGGGLATMSGFVDYGFGEAPIFRLNGAAHGIRIRYPQGTSSTLDAQLQLTGTTASSQLTGEVTVTRVRFDQQFDLARTLGLSRVAAVGPAANPILGNMQLDVHVVSSPEMRFELAQTRNVQLEANLRARGTAARPALLGRISLLAGEVTFAGTQYELDRGDIQFTNPFRIEPTISLSLSTRIQQYDITIALNGAMDRLNVNYRSDPPLPSTDIQMMLITGQTRQGTGTAPPPTFSQIGANTILSQALNTAVTSRVERIFGVTRLKIDPLIGGPETNSGARVTLQQQVTQDVRFTYITNPAQTQQTVVQVEWQVDANWSVLAVRDQNGLFGIDLRWRKRFH